MVMQDEQKALAEVYHNHMLTLLHQVSQFISNLFLMFFFNGKKKKKKHPNFILHKDHTE